MRRRAAITWVLLGIATAIQTPARSAGSPGDDRLMVIYADEAWYRERPEPEETWQGILRRRPAVEGPGGRPGLTFALHSTDNELPVYAAGADERLAPHVGTPVVVSGKLVDLRGEGFGRELWIGTIRPQQRPEQR